MTNIESVWNRISQNAGATFNTKTSQSFTYSISGAVLTIIRNGKEINRNISISNFVKALSQVPLSGPGEISNLVQGSSYVYAILMDERIKRSDW